MAESSIDWTISIEAYARLVRDIMEAEAGCTTQGQIDAAAPAVMRRMFPHMGKTISAAIATRTPINLIVEEIRRA